MLGIVIVLSSAYLWYRYYKFKNQMDDDYHEKENYHRKHNCVVTYSKIHGISGWPGFKDQTVRISCQNYNDSLSPLLHFLHTTQTTLDIAVMTITSNVILGTLLSLLKKGIKLRIIINYDHAMKLRVIKEFRKYGAEVAIYVGKIETGSIFHYKYAIKDYETDFNALCCGSLNWTNAAFADNYENIVFTTNKAVIQEFYTNFIYSFNFVTKSMEDDMYVKVKLEELGS